MNSATYLINDPKPNLVLDLDPSNVNDSDVWVQTVNDRGEVMTEWKKVPAIYSENITYNSFVASERDIFSVITRDDDRVSIRFADGIFGNAPVGNVKVWTRASNGDQYSIRPSELSRVTVPIVYYNRRGVKCTLTMTLALQETVANATTRETEEQIKRRAPSIFGTQNRMVSGEDYNVFPLSSNIIRKLKSVNRTYSGHSRFIDLNDPTGNYQNTQVFADDGILYEESFNQYVEVPLTFNRTPTEFLLLDLQPMLASTEVVYAAQRYLTGRSVDDLAYQVPVGCTWQNVSTGSASATGYFSAANQYFRAGSMLQFTYQRNGISVSEWATIGGITYGATTPPSTNRYGSVTINAPVPNGATITKVIPSFNWTVDSTAAAVIKQKVEDKTSFSLWYNPDTGLWKVEAAESLLTSINAVSRLPSFKVASAFFTGSGVWQIIARGVRLVFESEAAVKWFNDPSIIVDSETGAKKNDLIRVLQHNSNLRDAMGRGLDKNYDLDIASLIQYGNGYAEPSRVQVKLSDFDADGQPDNPDLYRKMISGSERTSRLFWRKTNSNTISGFKPYYGVTIYAHEADRVADQTPKVAQDGDVVAYQISASNDVYNNTFWVWSNGTWLPETQRFRTAIGRGANVCARWVDGNTTTFTTDAEREIYRLNYQWKHYASSDHRIDPSPVNIHDMFVLTDEYDFGMRQWIANGANVVEKPAAPSELDLRLTFQDYDKFKMGSDVMVWRPVKYKLLFGPGADATLRAQFKIVKLPGANLSDGEIKSAVVGAINRYFAADAWGFGDTFYASQLTAYIFNQLVGSVASVELVPLFDEASFGDLQEIVCRSDELFISTAQVGDIQLIGSNTPTNLRMR